MHAHNVYFALKDNSRAAVEQLIEDSKKYLAPIPGIKSFACGIRETDLNRAVNDKEFDVSVHILFESKEAHDAYQVSNSHHEYVTKNEANWARTRVFDSAII